MFTVSYKNTRTKLHLTVLDPTLTLTLGTETVVGVGAEASVVAEIIMVDNECAKVQGVPKKV